MIAIGALTLVGAARGYATGLFQQWLEDRFIKAVNARFPGGGGPLVPGTLEPSTRPLVRVELELGPENVFGNRPLEVEVKQKEMDTLFYDGVDNILLPQYANIVLVFKGDLKAGPDVVAASGGVTIVDQTERDVLLQSNGPGEINVLTPYEQTSSGAKYKQLKFITSL
jgi:hypothetical protein